MDFTDVRVGVRATASRTVAYEDTGSVWLNGAVRDAP